MPCCTALILDDDEAFLDALPAALQFKFPHLSVETVRSVHMASTRLKAQRFNVIMADLVMPRANGFEIFGQAQLHQPMTPVIAMTGRYDEATGRTAFSKGAFDLLWKPLDRDDLMRVLRCALDTYGLRDLIERQRARIRRLNHLIEQTRQCMKSSHPQLGAISDRTRKIEEATAQRILRNVDLLTRYRTAREDHLKRLRQGLASQLDAAHTRAEHRLAEVGVPKPPLG